MQTNDQILQKLGEIEQRFVNLESDVKALTTTQVNLASDVKALTAAQVNLASDVKALTAAQKVRDDMQKVQNDAQEHRLTRIDSEVKETRVEMKETRVEIIEIRKEAADQRVSQARVEAKLDGLIDHLKEQRTDHSERWKITGIIASIFIGVAALVKSFFFG